MHTVRGLIDHFQVTQKVVLAWIASGELRAVNVGRSPGSKRPRWRIPADALAAFEAARAAAPAASPVRARRRAKPAGVIQFYS